MAVCGAILGTLLSALYRRNLIEEQKLDFPIGNAAYNTLVTGIKKGRDSVKLFLSMGFSAIFTFFRDFFGWIPSVAVIFGGNAYIAPISIYVSPMVVAIGALIGKIFAIAWFGGAIFGHLILSPVGISLGWLSDLAAADIFRQNLGLGLLIGTGLGIFVKAIIGTIGKGKTKKDSPVLSTSRYPCVRPSFRRGSLSHSCHPHTD